MLNRIGLNDVTTTKCDINDKTNVAETSIRRRKNIYGENMTPKGIIAGL